MYTIKTIRDGKFFDSTIFYQEVQNKVELKYVFDDIEITVNDDLAFFALVKLRQRLENLNLKLLCNGSRYDVYPSGSSAIGILAYELTLNKPAKKTVNIFDPADIDKIGSIEEQKAFREKWTKSLG